MLVCEATGFPAPAITWFQNDTEQDNTTFTNEQVNVYTTRSVFMMPMPDRNDSGQYHCQATVDGYEAVNSNTSLVLVQGMHNCIVTLAMRFLGLNIYACTLITV